MAVPVGVPAEVAHQPGDGAAGHRYAFAVQLPQDLPHPIDAEVVGVDAADLCLQLRIPQRPCTGRPLPGGVIGVRGDLQSVAGKDSADRLDPEQLPVLVDERYKRFDGRSSSAAKKAEAALRISFALRS